MTSSLTSVVYFQLNLVSVGQQAADTAALSVNHVQVVVVVAVAVLAQIYNILYGLGISS